MARSEQVQRQYEDQRQAQVALRAAFLAQFVQAWRILNWNDIDGSTQPWVDAVMPAVRHFRQASADLAVAQYADTRVLTAPKALESPPPAVEFGPARLGETHRVRLGRDRRVRLSDGGPARIDWSGNDQAAELSLKITGPGEMKRQARLGRSPMEAQKRALVTSSGSAGRHVLVGDRVTTLTLVANDPEAVGWARLTDANPCSFCALLASRGPVYKTEASAGFKAHDACACKPVALFSETAAWPGDAREIRRFYDEVVAEHSGDDRRLAFRRAWDERRARRRTVEVA